MTPERRRLDKVALRVEIERGLYQRVKSAFSFSICRVPKNSLGVSEPSDLLYNDRTEARRCVYRYFRSVPFFYKNETLIAVQSLHGDHQGEKRLVYD